MPRPGDTIREKEKVKEKAQIVGLLFYKGTPHPHTLNATTATQVCVDTTTQMGWV